MTGILEGRVAIITGAGGGLGGTGFTDHFAPLNGASLIPKLVNLTREYVSQVNPGAQK